MFHQAILETPLGRDARVALRGLVHRPLFAATIVLTLALGIGANTAIFSAVDAVLLHPLPAPALDRLVTVYDDLPGINLSKAPLSPGESLDLMARTDLFDASAAYRESSLTLTGIDPPRRVAATATMGRFFDLFGARPAFGRLYRADESGPGHEKVAVRSGLPAGAVVKLARTAVAGLDPQVPLYDVETLEERMAGSLATWRLAMAVLAGFAALSLLLAVLGVYGVISYGVSQRTREIGIRMALGARSWDVERMVLANGLFLSGLGAAAGTLVFLGLGRVLEALLYGVGPRDPAVLLGSVALLGAVAALAAYGPAQRAARVEPVVALRGE